MNPLVMPADMLARELTRQGKSISGPVTTMRTGEGRYVIAGWVFAYHIPVATNVREPVSTLVVVGPKGLPGPRLEGVVFRHAVSVARQWAIFHAPIEGAPPREPPDEIRETLLFRIRTLRREADWYVISASNNHEENEVGHRLFRIKPSAGSQPVVLYRRATGPVDLLAQVLPEWRLSVGPAVGPYLETFLVRNRAKVHSALARALAHLAVRRYLAAPWPPPAPCFVRDHWKQELRFEGDTANAQALAQEYRRQTGREPGEGIEHRVGDFRAEWLFGDDEISIQGPVVRADQRILLARYGFAQRGSEHIQRWLPARSRRSAAKSGSVASAIWTRARNAVDKLAAIRSVGNRSLSKDLD